MIAFDLTDKDAIREAFATLRAEHGGRIAAVIHLAAYFDFTGAESPLYQSVNVEGTRNPASGRAWSIMDSTSNG